MLPTLISGPLLWLWAPVFFTSAAVNTTCSEVDSAEMMPLVLLALFLSCSDVIWERRKAA